MSKVLIVGPNFYNYSLSVRDAFVQHGWEAVVETYDNPVHPYTPIMKWRWKLSKHRDRMTLNSEKSFKRFIEKRFEQEKPDLVFIMNGKILLPETLDYFRKSAKVVLWMFDSRGKVQVKERLLGHIDTLFCYDYADVEWYNAHDIEAHFLPQACDTKIYKPLGLQKDIDILFVGNIWCSQKRQDILMSIIKEFPDQKIVVFGLQHPWYKGIKAWITRPHKEIFKNTTLSPEKVNEQYNRSRVVLNIHQEQLGNGANPRVFEICGSGAYQVCDSNKYVRSIYPQGSIGLYTDVQGAVSEIRAALNEDTTEKSRTCLETVREYHTFERRIQEALDIIFTARQECRC